VASITAMVKKLAGLVDTKDVTDWENSFLQSVLAKTKDGDDTRCLTEKQITVLERIYSKHFGD
jgi:hypothetical protein